MPPTAPRSSNPSSIQPSLGLLDPFENQGLFSDHLLREHIGIFPEWQAWTPERCATLHHELKALLGRTRLRRRDHQSAMGAHQAPGERILRPAPPRHRSITDRRPPSPRYWRIGKRRPRVMGCIPAGKACSGITSELLPRLRKPLPTAGWRRHEPVRPHGGKGPLVSGRGNNAQDPRPS